MVIAACVGAAGLAAGCQQQDQPPAAGAPAAEPAPPTGTATQEPLPAPSGPAEPAAPEPAAPEPAAPAPTTAEPATDEPPCVPVEGAGCVQAPTEPPEEPVPPPPSAPGERAATLALGDARTVPQCAGVQADGRGALFVLTAQSWGAEPARYRLEAQAVAGDRGKGPLLPVLLADQTAAEGDEGFPNERIDAQIVERLPQLNAQITGKRLLACYPAPGRPTEPGFAAAPEGGPVRVFVRDGALWLAREGAEPVRAEDLPGPDWSARKVWYHPQSPHVFVALERRADTSYEQTAVALTP
jgi:hypothetical protein